MISLGNAAPEDEPEYDVQENEPETDEPQYINEAAKKSFDRELDERAIPASVRERIVFGTIPNHNRHQPTAGIYA